MNDYFYISGAIVAILLILFVIWCFAGLNKNNPVDPDDPNLGSKAEERRREYFIKTPFYIQFQHKWNKKNKTICYKNLTSGDCFKFTPIPDLSDDDFKDVLVNIPLKYNKIISEKEFDKTYKNVRLMNIDVLNNKGTHKIGTVTTIGINVLKMRLRKSNERN
jgi:hypothetical protein